MSKLTAFECGDLFATLCDLEKDANRVGRLIKKRNRTGPKDIKCVKLIEAIEQHLMALRMALADAPLASKAHE
jgi:hypothetical protein